MSRPRTHDAEPHTDTPGRPESWEIEMFHDGDCPLCNREVRLLQKLDKGGKIRFTDIADPKFDPAAHGKDLDTLMAEIHARLPDGAWVKGVEVFRLLYAAVGFRRVVAISRWPIISPVLGLGYRLFAKNRLRLTGRCKKSDDGKSCQVSPKSHPATEKIRVSS